MNADRWRHLMECFGVAQPNYPHIPRMLCATRTSTLNRLESFRAVREALDRSVSISPDLINIHFCLFLFYSRISDLQLSFGSVDGQLHDCWTRRDHNQPAHDVAMARQCRLLFRHHALLRQAQPVARRLYEIALLSWAS